MCRRMPCAAAGVVAAARPDGPDRPAICKDERMSEPDTAAPRPVPTSASYSITVRVYAIPDSAVVGRLATAVSEAGGLVTAVDVSESRHDRITIDVTCSAVNGEHAEQIVQALRAL